MADHDGDDSARWQLLGTRLKQRRAVLDPRWRNRRAFAEDNGVDYRLVYDIEEARRANFGVPALTALEVSYRLAPGSFRAFVAGGDLDLTGPAGAAGAVSVVRSSPGPEAPGDEHLVERALPFLPAEGAERVNDLTREILARAEVARAVRPAGALAGSMVFPHGPEEAAREWDRLAAYMDPDAPDGRLFSDTQLAKAVAWQLLQAQAPRQARVNGG